MAQDVARPTPLNEAVRAARPAIATAAFFSLFVNVLALVSPLYMLQVYDRVLSSRNELTLLFLTLLAAFLYLVYGLLESLRSRVLVRGGAKFERTIRAPLFQSVLTATLGRTQTSDAQAFRDADTVREFMTGSGLIAFCDIPWVPVFILACFLLHPVFGYLAIAAGIITFVIAIVNELVTKRSLSRATNASIAAHADATASLRNSEVMRAMGMASGLQARWARSRDEQVVWQATASDRGSAMMAMLKSFRQIVQLLILGGGAFLVIKGDLSAGGIIAGSILVGRALAPIESAVGSWKTFQSARSAWGRVQRLFAVAPGDQKRMALPAPVGVLTVEGVVASAPGSRIPILKGVSCYLPAGEAMAIIGPSAAGKSTLIRVLCGVWPAAGVVRLDGFDITQWDPEALGPHIGYLPQDVELFSGTIAQNIARFRDVGQDVIIRAAKLAGVHEMIQQMSDGYDTQIGDGGSSLSGGQRQRLGLARAIMGEPRLVLLDEPNANLDASGEEALIVAVQQLKKQGTTVVFITHKTNMLGIADKIMVLNGGMVQAFGERDEVIAKIFGGPKAVPAASAPPPLENQKQA